MSTSSDSHSLTTTVYRKKNLKHNRSKSTSYKRQSSRRERNILSSSKTPPRLRRRTYSSQSIDLSSDHSNNYSRSNYKICDNILRPYKQNKSYSKSISGKSSPELNNIKQKRMEYSKKINDTSLFAELVKDKHKRKKAIDVSHSKFKRNLYKFYALTNNC